MAVYLLGPPETLLRFYSLLMLFKLLPVAPNLSSSPLSTTMPLSVPGALPEAALDGFQAGWPRS